MPASLTGRHLLLLDNSFVESSENVTFGLEPAKKFSGNPVISSDDPLVQPSLYGSVDYQPGRGYRIWYSTWIDAEKPMFVFNETSKDGIHWEKPCYDIIKIKGKKSHAVFGTDIEPHITEIFTVLQDEEESDPGRRYKMAFKYKEKGYPSPYVETVMGLHRKMLDDLTARGKHDLVETYRRVISDGLFLPTQRRAAGFAFSSDGIHWNRVEPLAIPDIGDISHLTWDPYRKRYLLYARDFFLPEDVHEKYKNEEWYRKIFWGRAVRIYESADFKNWTPGNIVMYADINDLPGDEIYSMAVFPYEGIYIGLVQVYHAFPGENTLEIQLAVSSDGLNWKRVGSRQPFIPLGDIGEWDRFNNSIASAPVMVGDEIRFYYSGRSYRHKPYADPDNGPQRSAIGFASIKRDRFAYGGASFDGGTITTNPMLVRGSCLHLNANSKHGTIVVKILNSDDQPIEGMVSKPVQIDSLDTPVHWPNGNLENLAHDKSVRLRFELKNAKIFSFWAE